MYNNDDIVALRAALQESIQANHQSAKAMLTLRTEMVQREQSIRVAFKATSFVAVALHCPEG